MVLRVAREIKVPFQVGTAGLIDYTDDPVEQAVQHILSVVATNPGERVMRPAYGVPTQAALFGPNDPLVQADLASEMRVNLAAYVPEVFIESIDMVPSSLDDGMMGFKISFGLVGSNVLYAADIFVGGRVQERTTPA